ncbi:MAG: fumarylacetoacetate hydrolase family protein [Chitinophagaceae bacterium]|nr:fumarylacetoacetate hydrolase family protein [Chitinophagaceae bacterium]MCB9056190.1 fumarylacetoacetate hydrolase family protein [Chitinophagales bacterium]
MKVYRTTEGIIINNKDLYYNTGETNWDQFINNDDLYNKCDYIIQSVTAVSSTSLDTSTILAPVQNQELWACGVTYLRSKEGRQEESKDAGGGDFYARVYEAERPEVFFKATPHRISGHNAFVRIRKDSTWDVPEPELTLVVASSGKIVGYTIGNDMSSRSIEGENPLYLPQAKTYDECAGLGPCVLVTKNPLDKKTVISLLIKRNKEIIFEGGINLEQMKRTPDELVSFVFRESSFPHGCLIMTGTGIVPGNDFTLQSGDEISITIEPIGTLVNFVR